MENSPEQCVSNGGGASKQFKNTGVGLSTVHAQAAEERFLLVCRPSGKQRALHSCKRRVPAGPAAAASLRSIGVQPRAGKLTLNAGNWARCQVGRMGANRTQVQLCYGSASWGNRRFQ
ncbi:UNVERIFIED_CONTAM: hypothetical protein K2H54_045617 [Gekko kuhli]